MTTENTPRRIAVQGQYIKDLSFESPNSPASLLQKQEKPAIEINIDLKANTLQQNLYEVSLMITAKASTGNNTLFITELTYGGLFSIQGISEAELEVTLMVYCPSILFPFARRIVADATRDGGFLPLMLDPIDFAALYQQRKKDIQKTAPSATTETTSTTDESESETEEKASKDKKSKKDKKKKKQSSNF